MILAFIPERCFQLVMMPFQTCSPSSALAFFWMLKIQLWKDLSLFSCVWCEWIFLIVSDSFLSLTSIPPICVQTGPTQTLHQVLPAYQQIRTASFNFFKVIIWNNEKKDTWEASLFHEFTIKTFWLNWILKFLFALVNFWRFLYPKWKKIDQQIESTDKTRSWIPLYLHSQLKSRSDNCHKPFKID